MYLCSTGNYTSPGTSEIENHMSVSDTDFVPKNGATQKKTILCNICKKTIPAKGENNKLVSLFEDNTQH